MTSVPNPGGVLVCFAVRDEAKHFHAPASTTTLVTGIGARNAAASLKSALERSLPRLVLTCGYAGGLDPQLPRGDVIFDASDASELAARLKQLGARPANFHCSGRIAVTMAEKQSLREQTRADAVEMESGIIRGMCRERGIAAATIRVISDDARTDLPLDFNRLAKPDGNISYARLALTLLRSPGHIPRLRAFQQELDVCSRRLGAVLEGLLQRGG
jgi:adenosylhomocysteine nucleosidase